MSKKDTREFIMETAFKWFLDKGYRNTSMSDLVIATQLSKGAFYHYFKNKEELYQEVVHRYFISYYKQIDWNLFTDKTVAEMEGMIQEFYRSFVPEILSLTPKGLSRYFILFFEAYEEYPEFRQEVRTFYEQLREILEAQLSKEGNVNPSLAAVHLIAKYEGFMFWVAVFPEQNIEGFMV